MKTPKLKSRIESVIGRRDGYGKAAHTNGYSHLVKLDCGHRQFIKNSRYRGIGQTVTCESCKLDQWRQSHVK